RITSYSSDPVTIARQFRDVGVERIHVIDLDGARAGHPVNRATLEAIAAVGVIIEFGGGIRESGHIQETIDSGADEIILGSTLINRWEALDRWIRQFPGRLIACIDAVDGLVATHGWQNISAINDVELARMVDALGFNRLIYTDINRDGTLSGPNLEKLAEIAESTTMSVIAAGGVKDIQDIQAVKMINADNLSGVIVGKAIYDGRITLEELAACLHAG
ncbi:HisA/HisF-related TIM barrel protein, partial [Candidatus Neomarinimicrobiota bacterium]